MTLYPERPNFLPHDVIFESFTFPAFDLNYSVNAGGVVRAFLDQPDPKPGVGRRGIYVHVPFCDTICQFCPFEKRVGAEDAIQAYFNALLKEIRIGAESALIRSWEVGAIYIGGGTPSVVGADRISALLATLGAHLNLAADVEITLEVEPKSATEEVLLAGREGGVTRVSFGVQTLDPVLRQMVNLTATLDQIHETVERTTRLYANTNLDMIAGFPGQDVDGVIADMHAAAALGIGSISAYPMDYVAVLPKLLNKIRSGDLPPAAVGRARWDMFHEARRALQDHYTAQNMYCFGQPAAPKCRYMFEILYGGYHDQAVGFGLGAYSMIRGLAYSNVRTEADYVRRIDEGVLPISQVSPGHAYEKSFVYAPKRLKADLREAVDLDIADSIMPKVEALEAAGLVAVDGDVMTLTQEGEHEYASIMVAFMSDAQRRLYDRVCRRVMSDLNWDLDGPIDAQRARARAMGATNALPMPAMTA